MIIGEGRGTEKSRNMYRRSMGMENGVRIDGESGWGGQGRGEQQGKMWKDCNGTTTIKKKKTLSYKIHIYKYYCRLNISGRSIRELNREMEESELEFKINLLKFFSI